MSKFGPKNARNRSSSSSSDLDNPSSVSPHSSINDIFVSFHEAITGHLLNHRDEPNRLFHVQALREQLTDDNKDKLTSRAKQQASALIEARSLNNNFIEKQRVINRFLEIIRRNIPAPKITPDMVKATLLSLKAQFDNKAQARMLVVALTDKIEHAKLDIAQLEVNKPVVASNPSSSSTVVTPNHLEIAKTTLVKLESEAKEADTASQKPTDIPVELRDIYTAFVNHTLSVNRILQAITYEIQFPSSEGELTLAQAEVAEEQWRTIEAGKTSRLVDVDKSGGKFTGIQARVADWYKKMPRALSSREMATRDDIHPYEEGEIVKTREERVKQVSGLPSRRTQMDEKAVARDKASRKNQYTAPIAKQLHELDDERRREFEKLGIKSVPKNQQSILGAAFRAVVGAECWNTVFEDEPTLKSPTPPRRTMMEEGVPLPFPQRKDHYEKSFSPLLDRHLTMGTKEGFLVGQKSKPKDEYKKPVESAEIAELVANLRRVKI